MMEWLMFTIIICLLYFIYPKRDRSRIVKIESLGAVGQIVYYVGTPPSQSEIEKFKSAPEREEV